MIPTIGGLVVPAHAKSSGAREASGSSAAHFTLEVVVHPRNDGGLCDEEGKEEEEEEGRRSGASHGRCVCARVETLRQRLALSGRVAEDCGTVA